MAARTASSTTYARDTGAREALILEHLPLVHHVIGRLAIGFPGIVDREDLVAHGVVGLIQAIDRYDPTLGVPFGPWATLRIRGAVIDAMRALDLVSTGTRRRVRRLQESVGRLTAELGRSPNDEEIRAALGVRPDEYADLLDAAACQVVSLDSTIDEEGAPLSDLLAGPDDPAESGSIRVMVGEAVRRLDRREQLVLSLYYAEELTCQEIGEVLGIHKTGVVRLHARAIVKLRSLLGVADVADPPSSQSRGKRRGSISEPDPSAAEDHGVRPPDRAAGPDHSVRESDRPAGVGGRYAGARRAYLSGRGVELGAASG
jgi:RNA polymerase sigma factor for flagellar operon FliA